MGDDEFRVPRDIVVHLFRRAHPKPLLMLRRTPERGGFWQGVSGAPVVGETDREAAVREVREETGLDVEGSLFSLDVAYSYRLDPARQDRWQRIYGPEVYTVQVNSFAAEVPDHAPALDPREHDRFSWCSYQEAWEMLAWPVESDALPHRRLAIESLRDRMA
jgi:8-oxo-dGTP pyrophosphatase MutT (NUDIX family)